MYQQPAPIFPVAPLHHTHARQQVSKNLGKKATKNAIYFFGGVYVFTFFYVFFVGAVQGCDVGGAETQCRIYSGKWYDGASAWGGTGYNVGAGVVRYSLSGLGKLLKRFLGGYVYHFSIMVCSCLTYHLQKCGLCLPWSAVCSLGSTSMVEDVIRNGFV